MLYSGVALGLLCLLLEIKMLLVASAFFHIKRNLDGSISKYKAHLVDFTQTPAADFHDTFPPFVCPQTMKIILSLALEHSWQMHQLELNIVFLQGTLTKQVLMAQPLYFKHNLHPHYVCKFHKAIYGLRQAPCAWHDALNHLSSFIVFKLARVIVCFYLFLGLYKSLLLHIC